MSDPNDDGNNLLTYLTKHGTPSKNRAEYATPAKPVAVKGGTTGKKVPLVRTYMLKQYFNVPLELKTQDTIVASFLDPSRIKENMEKFPGLFLKDQPPPTFQNMYDYYVKTDTFINLSTVRDKKRSESKSRSSSKPSSPVFPGTAAVLGEELKLNTDNTEGDTVINDLLNKMLPFSPLKNDNSKKREEKKGGGVGGGADPVETKNGAGAGAEAGAQGAGAPGAGAGAEAGAQGAGAPGAGAPGTGVGAPPTPAVAVAAAGPCGAAGVGGTGGPVMTGGGAQIAPAGNTGLGQTYSAVPQFNQKGVRSDPTVRGEREWLPPVIGASGVPAPPTRDPDFGKITHQGTGDSFIDVPDKEPGTDNNLRSQFGEASIQSVIPTWQKQVESDIRFDMFDTVNPGFGEGSDNKLFMMQQGREARIVHMEPHFFPGDYIGAVNGFTVPPWQLQREMPEQEVKKYSDRKRQDVLDKAEVYNSMGEMSTNILGDDVGYAYSHSAGELKRRKLSPLEPVIRTDMDWQHVKGPTGVKLNKLGMRRMHDALRYPRNLQSSLMGAGGPTLDKRRSLEVILH